MVLNQETIHVINGIQGVIKFVGTGRLPMPLRPDEVNRLLGIEEAVKEEEPQEQIPFLVGQVVEITEGPFSDFSGTVEEVDRKSTRLNSSHSQISYAVFCLKKKKKNQNDTRRQTKTAVLTPTSA